MEYYTIKDVMDMLGVSKGTAYKIAELDGVPTIRIGRIIRIEKKGFDRWRDAMIGRKIF